MTEWLNWTELILFMKGVFGGRKKWEHSFKLLVGSPGVLCLGGSDRHGCELTTSMGWLRGSVSGVRCHCLYPLSFYACVLSCVWLFAIPWTVAHQAPLSMGFFRQDYWSGLPFPPPEGSSQPRDRTHVFSISCLAGKFFTPQSLGKPSFFRLTI